MAAPNLKEIEWAISELERKESSEERYALLAALYTCRNEVLGVSPAQPQATSYSEPQPAETTAQYGDSEFLRAVSGRDQAAAWAVIDELMETLYVINRRAYDSVIRKLNRI